MLMVMPRAISSGARSIRSNATNRVFEPSCSASTFVMAAVNVVLPWSTWPIVPMFTFGLVRTYSCLVIEVSSGQKERGLAAARPLLTPRASAVPGRARGSGRVGECGRCVPGGQQGAVHGEEQHTDDCAHRQSGKRPGIGDRWHNCITVEPAPHSSDQEKGGLATAVSAVQELSGTTLKGYQLETCLGWSSHTAVYGAWRGGATWAVKIVDADLAPDGALADRLRRDAEILAHVGSASILPINDTGRAGRLTYAATPLVRAPTLHDLMRSNGLSTEQAWAILSSLAEALDCAHHRGLVCRLLKPGHVLVEDGRIYLAEFGVASDRVGRLAMSASAYHVTAPQYLAPEQLEGRDPDHRADIYALAVLVFEILTGTELQGARSPLEAMRATLDGSPPSATERQPDLPSVSTSCSAARWRATP